MTAKWQTIDRGKRWASTVILIAVITAVSTYGTWGYERHLAVESFPVSNAEIYPEFQFAIEYRKRFDFLPGAVHKLIGVDRVDITQLRSEAVTAYDWSLPDLRGTTYCFVRDYEPLPGWTKRDPISGPGSAGLN